MRTLASPLKGRVVPLERVADPVFADRVVGDGVAIEPASGEVCAPVEGTVAKLFRGGHAFVVQTSDGVEVLTHIGLDTVELEGEGFTCHVDEHDAVTAGQHVVTVDLERLRGRGIDLTSPVVVLSHHSVRPLATGAVDVGAPLMEVRAEEQA
ncbi:MAG TPA: PTS glucose transporter subunit IIA [Egibacteraceae bacterium]|jgi:glucose-specific phosphotransferase system IIA component|nr:PTS glucose transporter subunit IIA [Egibacteraceae bacterium]